ncbi:MAG: hypothetical protein KGQ41_06175 [Alphaproteobacteria bacterium]|nr:hypothetical protein [Alphaproteobacteria bacterium]
MKTEIKLDQKWLKAAAEGRVELTQNDLLPLTKHLGGNVASPYTKATEAVGAALTFAYLAEASKKPEDHLAALCSLSPNRKLVIAQPTIQNIVTQAFPEITRDKIAMAFGARMA